MIRMVSKDEQPIPLSDQKYIDIFQKSMKEWGIKMQSSESAHVYGFMDLIGLDAKPYGEVY